MRNPSLPENSVTAKSSEKNSHFWLAGTYAHFAKDMEAANTHFVLVWDFS